MYRSYVGVGTQFLVQRFSTVALERRIVSLSCIFPSVRSERDLLRDSD